MTVYLGAGQAPYLGEALSLTVRATPLVPDLSAVVAGRLLVRRPGEVAPVVWDCELGAQDSRSVQLIRILAEDGTDVPRSGKYHIVPELFIAETWRRCLPRTFTAAERQGAA